MQIIGYVVIIISVIVFYIFILLAFSIISAKKGGRNVDNPPDWGKIQEHWIETANSRKLECWVVYPDKLIDKIGEEVYRDNKAVLLTHGWGRNRDRMVSRAKIWGEQGYTTILFSARNHGNSDSDILPMNIYKFTQDIESIISWWGRELVLQGHSIGAGASIIVAARNNLVRAVVADAPPRAIPNDLQGYYKSALGIFTFLLYPGMILFIQLMFRKLTKEEYSPIHAVKNMSKPAMIQYGRHDIVFSHEFIKTYQETNLSLITHLYEDAHHSDLCRQENYYHNLTEFIRSIDV